MPTTVPTTVTVDLSGTPYVLTPTLDHQRTLNRLQGGFMPLLRAVRDLDGETMALVVAAGVGARGKAVESIVVATYGAGLADLVGPLTRFIGICANGGREATTTAAAPVAESGAGAAAPTEQAEAGTAS